MAKNKPVDEKSIDELRADLRLLDAEMMEVRDVKEQAIARLRELQRVRDAIAEPLERKLAVERATSGRPAQVIGEPNAESEG